MDDDGHRWMSPGLGRWACVYVRLPGCAAAWPAFQASLNAGPSSPTCDRLGLHGVVLPLQYNGWTFVSKAVCPWAMRAAAPQARLQSRLPLSTPLHAGGTQGRPAYRLPVACLSPAYRQTGQTGQTGGAWGRLQTCGETAHPHSCLRKSALLTGNN